MTAGQNVADIMRTIRLLRRENAELRQDKDKWLGEVVKLRKRLTLRCPCPEETAESSTGGRWKAWKAWFSSGSRARPNDGQNDGQSAQAPDSGFRWMWRSTFHRVRRSVTDFLAATATVTGTSLRIVATIFWLCVSFIGTNVLCLMWLKAAKIWTGCKAAVNWYFHLPLWVVLRQAAGQLAKLLGRLQWESESEKGDGNLKQEMKNLKKALSDLQQASRSRKQSSSTDTVSGHNRDGTKSPRASFPPKRSHDTRGRRCASAVTGRIILSGHVLPDPRNPMRRVPSADEVCIGRISAQTGLATWLTRHPSAQGPNPTRNSAFEAEDPLPEALARRRTKGAPIMQRHLPARK